MNMDNAVALKYHTIEVVGLKISLLLTLISYMKLNITKTCPCNKRRNFEL